MGARVDGAGSERRGIDGGLEADIVGGWEI